MKIKKTEWFYLQIVFLAAVAVMLPILVFGIPSGNDLPQHFQFAQAYYEAIVSGDGFPSWSARENYGYGSIGIRFYPPLAYYAMAFARILTGNWFIAAWLTFTFWMALGCFGVYFWTRWWLSPKESAAAGVFYAFFPYHLSQLYSSFVYADFAGAAILPFCFAFLTRALEREKKSDFLGLAVCYALLVLTHLPSAIIGSISLGVYALVFLKKEKWLRQTLKSSLAILTGLAASSFYWIVMVSEMSWLNHAGERYQSGHYYFANRFFPNYLHALPADFKPNLLLSDTLTSISLLFLVTPVVYFLYRKIKKAEENRPAQIFRTVWLLGLFACFMTTPLSYPVWKIITPLQKIQFPLRWTSIIAMCGSIVTAAAFYYLLKGEFLKKRAGIYACLLFVSIFLFIDFTYMLYPSSFAPIDRAKFESDMRELPAQENYVFWWSVWSDRKALENKEKVSIENRQTEIVNWKPEDRSFTVAEGAPAKARIGTFYYPHWRAEVNGNPVALERDENGAMIVPLAAEKSVVTLTFEEPLVVRCAALFSIFVWLFLAAALSILTFRKSLPSETPQPFSKEEFTY